MLLISIIFSSWLIPNYSFFIPSFWMEFIATSSLLLFFYSNTKNPIKIERKVLIFFIISLSLLLTDFLFREEIYYTDYIIGCCYISVLFLCISLGQQKNFLQKEFYFSIIIASSISAVIAIVQWNFVEIDNIYIRNIPPNGRPFANTGQPNHLGTILFMGVMACLGLNRKIPCLLNLCIITLLAFCASITQSRTTILQFSIIPLAYVFFRNEKKIDYKYFHPPFILIASYIFLNYQDKFSPPLARDIIKEKFSSMRWEHWDSLLQAIIKKPLTGYGWLRTPEAQLIGTTQTAHESILSYSHNIIIDVYIWFGVIIGSIFSILIIHFGCKIFFTRKISDSQIVSLIAIIGFSIHSFLEYPFAYFHLLIPFGLFFGIFFQKTEHGNLIVLNKFTTYTITLLTSSTLLLFSTDYILSLETIEKKRYIYNEVVTPNYYSRENPYFDSTKSWISAFLIKPQKNITLAEIKNYEKAAIRYGTSRLLLHAAIARKNYKDDLKADEWMSLLCKVHSLKECQKATIEFLNNNL